MKKEARLKLKQFLEDHFDFETLKKVGFFGPEVRKRDYEKIAARICLYFGYKSVYEYGKIRCSGMLSMGNENDISGLEPGYAIMIRPNVDMGCPLNWERLQTYDRADFISNDKFLN